MANKLLNLHCQGVYTSELSVRRTIAKISCTLYCIVGGSCKMSSLTIDLLKNAAHPLIMCHLLCKAELLRLVGIGVLSCLQPSSIRGLVASWTNLLHFLLSLVFFNRSSNGIPVHCSMLSIHHILGSLVFLLLV